MTRENNKNVHVVTVVDSFHIRLNARLKARHVFFARNIIIVAKSRLKREDFQEVKTKEAIIESSSDEEYAYTIKKKTEHVSVVSKKTPKVNVTVTEKQCKFLLDTGATVSLLDQKTHDRIGAPKLTREKNPNLLPYGGGSSIKVMGQCKLTVETKHSINYNTFYVVEGNHGSLLGYPLATKLGLVKIINQVSDPKTKYPKLFEVIGKYKGAPMRVSVRLQRDIEEHHFIFATMLKGN